MEVISAYFKQGLLGISPYSTKRYYGPSIARKLSNGKIYNKILGGQCVACYSIGDNILSGIQIEKIHWI